MSLATLVLVIVWAGFIVYLKMAGRAVSLFRDAWYLWDRDRRRSWSTLRLAVGLAALVLFYWFVLGAVTYCLRTGTRLG